VAESMAYLQKEAGRAFDSRVVEIMARRYVELEALARAHSDAERAKLSVDAKISRGLAPDAGFAADGTKSAAEHTEFVESIASARAEAQLLFSISQDLTLSIDLPTMFVRFGEKLRSLIPFDTIAYYHVEAEELYPLSVSGKEEELFRRLRIPVGQGLSGWVAHEKKTILNGNPAVEPGFLNDRSTITNLRSALAVPVEGERGVIGVLALYSAKRDYFSRDHRRILMAVAARLAYQVENAMRYQKASGDAYTDELTGLYNSRWLVAELDAACNRAVEEQRHFALVVIDLDGFKLLNDTFGHMRGNDALRETAHRSKALLPATATMARMGGDEFVVLIPHSDESGAVELACRIQAESEQIGLGLFGDARLSASWGVSMYGVDGERPEALMAEADQRMYENKRSKNDRMARSLSQMAVGVGSVGGDQNALALEQAITRGT
jgi:diguanylate cyclase (GGDEF)-like protein